jgi:hypothetical protein
MDTINHRLASKDEYFRLFLVCAFPVHVWAIVTLLKWASVFMIHMNAYQIVSVTAYVLFFALLETLVVFGIFFFLSLVLPPKFLRPHIVSAGAIGILLASITAALIHLYEVWDFERINFHLWAGMWVSLGLVAAISLIFWLKRDQRVDSVIRSSVERLSLLSLIYLILDLLGGLVILMRNIL